MPPQTMSDSTAVRVETGKLPRHPWPSRVQGEWLWKEVAVGTVIQDKQRGNEDRNQRWDRVERVELFAQYGDLQAQGLSLRQAAKALDVPRSTLQAWRADQDSLDEHPRSEEHTPELQSQSNIVFPLLLGQKKKI